MAPKRTRSTATKKAKFGKCVKGRIQKTWPKGGPGRPTNSAIKGLHNPENMCYRRSVLQCLIHTPLFCNYLCRQDNCKGTDGEECVFCTLRNLAVMYWTENDDDERQKATDKFDLAIQEHHKWYSLQQQPFADEGNEQYDAHEFLLGLLQMLNDIDSSYGANKFAPAIPKLFDLTVDQSWKCQDCGQVHGQGPSQHRGIDGVSMANPNDNWIEDFLHGHFREQEIEGLGCNSPACKGKREIRRKRLVITSPPEILVVQLNRFTFNRKKMRVEKLKKRVWYDERLDLTGHTNSQEKLEYQLHGVVLHEGGSTGSGHYTAALKCQDGEKTGTANAKYVRQDGKKHVDKSKRLLFREPDDDFHTYMFVYQKVGTGEVQIT
ncbi:hypothetical protein Q7P37_011038 [Cladosporium fusiforme]